MDGGNRPEAERWLYTANKLLSARDLHGARSFAIRARESDPTYDASEHLLTVIDTLLAGESRINDHHRDWYGILQILRYTTNMDHIAAQYRRLALLLDPHRNMFAFASHAFSLVNDAWSVLSNSAKKAMYDSELRLLTAPAPPQHHPLPPQPQPTPRRNPRSRDEPNPNRPESAESSRQTRTVETDTGTSFWTSCPYCYVLYEYPKVYEECTLRCQSCRRGFHAVVIRSPPPLSGKDGSYCSWGFFPLGFSGNSKDVNGHASNWNPFSPLFPCPLKGSSKRRPQRNWAYYDDDAAAAFIELSDPSDDDSGDGDWRVGKNRGRKRTRGKKNSGDGRREPVERTRRGAHVGNDNVGSGASGNVNANAASAVLAGASRALNLDKPTVEGDLTHGDLLSAAYDRCGEVCAEYAKTFYLGTQLMTQERRKAIWAIYVWCRRTDELVDGPNASHITPKALDRWEQRLYDVFEGRPYDMYDAALSDTVSKYPVDIQPFKDMIEGMRLDLRKSRYNNFDELYLYCYYVAGTVGLMSVPVMGIAPESKASTESVYNAALALGIANQLTNILRDVGEDARRGRVYLPQDELAQAGLSDDDIFRGKVTDKWRNFMKGQIQRARMFFDEAEKGVSELNSASRWPVWASLLLYRQILDSIEANDYNNFTKRAYVGKVKKLLSLPAAYGRALLGPQKLTKMVTRSM